VNIVLGPVSHSNGRRIALLSALCLLAASLGVSPVPAPAQPAPARTPVTKRDPPSGRTVLPVAVPGPRSGESQPFWTGRPDSAAFVQRIERRLAAARAGVARMTEVRGARTVDNTLAPYDEAVNQVDIAASEAQLLENVFPDASLRGAGEAMGQIVSKYATEMSLDRDIYEAIKALDVSAADAETQYYVQRELRDFRLAGVDKDDSTRTRIKGINEELVKVGQEFNRNIREDVRSIKVKPADLDGLPQDFIDAHKPGADGMVTLDTSYPDYIPVMNYCKSDDVRKRLYLEYNNRAYPKNMDVLKHMLEGRYELANLVGYPTWADYITATKMTGSAKVVRDFIDKIVAVSAASADRDYLTLLKRKQKDVPGADRVEFWETGYWQESVRRSDYDFDSQSMRPYLPYDRVKQGVLGVTSQLFGVTFRKVKDAPTWDPAVECYEILDQGKLLGRFYLDMHPRKNKYSHAAHFGIRVGIKDRQLPEAALICNLPGGKPDDPGLCDIGDVTTFLHEFGHLLHNMFAGQHRWAGVSGIRTERDFVEAPSQMLEEWMDDPKTLQSFAKHYKTGESVPAELVRKMRRAEEFAKGMQVRRQMVYADLSLSIYDRDPAQVDVDRMAQDLVRRYQPFPYVEGTHFPCAFGHLDGYSAVYYTYMWSLVIAKDMFSAFDHDHLLDPTVARRYRAAVLAPGGSKPAAKLVEDFLKRPFGFEAYQRWLDRVD
jgi:thimet oligopeptidase